MKKISDALIYSNGSYQIYLFDSIIRRIQSMFCQRKIRSNNFRVMNYAKAVRDRFLQCQQNENAHLQDRLQLLWKTPMRLSHGFRKNVRTRIHFLSFFAHSKCHLVLLLVLSFRLQTEWSKTRR